MLFVSSALVCAIVSAAPTPQDLAEFARQLRPIQSAQTRAGTALEPASFSVSPRGYLKSISAPIGNHFPPLPADLGRSPATVARDFLLRHGQVFGVTTAAVDFREMRTRQDAWRNYARLQQVYRDVPVVAAEVIVQLTQQNGVEAVLGDFEADEALANNGQTPTRPELSADDAAAKARAAMSTQARGQQISNTTPQLALFAPAVLDETGPPQLVWDFEVFTPAPRIFHNRILVDAIRGDIVRVWTLIPTALYRQIRRYEVTSSGSNSCSATSPLVRIEGQQPSGIPDADNAYTYLGDTYNYYALNHARDSYDNLGATNVAVVNYCENCLECPWQNAQADFFYRQLNFGDGWAGDDTVAHEFTHFVTRMESGLIYTNVSGAINESFSDIWGEFVDQSNGRGIDGPEVRWLLGEDLALATLRSMKNPPQYDNPDRLGSPLYQHPTNTFDQGGVHNNSGVCNKLCYLLTDGDTFNGQTVYGLGNPRVIALFYRVQVNLLTSGAGWSELYQALRQAAINESWNYSDRVNLYRACSAVEIAGPGANLYVDKTSTCPIPTGLASCSFPGVGPYLTVSQGLSAASPADILHVRIGNYNEPMTINQIVTIKAENGSVSIGKP